jgi:hypothetical protein
VEVRSFSFPRKLGLSTPPVLAALAATLGLFGVGQEIRFYPIVLISAIGASILVISVIVAWVSAKSFLQTGSLNLLFLGVAVLAFGTLSILGGLVSIINTNSGNFLYLIGLMIAGGLHLVSAGLTYYGSPRRKNSLGLQVGTAYATTILVLIALSALALETNITGSISLPANPVLASTALLFLAAALLFSRVYLRSHSPTLFWYSLALATTAFAFVALLFSRNAGDLVSWTGIGGVLLGSAYFLRSLVATPKTSTSN